MPSVPPYKQLDLQEKSSLPRLKADIIQLVEHNHIDDIYMCIQGWIQACDQPMRDTVTK